MELRALEVRDPVARHECGTYMGQGGDESGDDDWMPGSPDGLCTQAANDLVTAPAGMLTDTSMPQHEEEEDDEDEEEERPAGFSPTVVVPELAPVVLGAAGEAVLALSKQPRSASDGRNDRCASQWPSM